MARQRLVERGENFQGFVAVTRTRQLAGIGQRHPQFVRTLRMGALQALERVAPLPGQIEDQTGMQVLQDAVGLRPGELVDRFDRGLALVRPDIGPAGEQRRRQIGHRAAHGLRELLARRHVLLLLDAADAEHEPGQAIGLLDLQQTFGQPNRLVDLAVLQNRGEGAAQQLGITRIAAQGEAVVNGRRRRVASNAGMTRGEIAARRRDARKCQARLRPLIA